MAIDLAPGMNDNTFTGYPIRIDVFADFDRFRCGKSYTFILKPLYQHPVNFRHKSYFLSPIWRVSDRIMPVVADSQ